MDAPECQIAFSTTLVATGQGLTCALAYAAALESVNDAIAAAGAICKEHNPKCTVAAVEVQQSDSDVESNVNALEDPTIFSCTVKITADVTVRCGGGETSAISSLSVSGVKTADVTCKQPARCPVPITGGGSTPHSSAPTIQESENLEAMLDAVE